MECSTSDCRMYKVACGLQSFVWRWGVPMARCQVTINSKPPASGQVVAYVVDEDLIFVTHGSCCGEMVERIFQSQAIKEDVCIKCLFGHLNSSFEAKHLRDWMRSAFSPRFNHWDAGFVRGRICYIHCCKQTRLHSVQGENRQVWHQKATL